MWSDTRFFQTNKFTMFLDFQPMKIVFMAIVRPVRRSLFLVVSSSDKSPNRQSDGDTGMRQAKKQNHVSGSSFPKMVNRCAFPGDVNMVYMSGVFYEQYGHISDEKPILNIVQCDDFYGEFYEWFVSSLPGETERSFSHLINGR